MKTHDTLGRLIHRGIPRPRRKPYPPFTCPGCGKTFKQAGDHASACGQDYVAKFWTYVDKNGPGGCWLWTSYRNERGYGLFQYPGKKNIRAHRFAYELKHGPTPSHRFCLHKCDVRHCVNPDHIFLGSYAENQRDMAQKKRSMWGDRNCKARLTNAQVIEIRSAYRYQKCGEKIVKSNARELAEQYGVRPTIITNAALGHTWKHLK